MTRQMKRKDRELTAEEAFEVPEEGTYGVLATMNSSSQHYAVPVNSAPLRFLPVHT